MKKTSFFLLIFLLGSLLYAQSVTVVPYGISPREAEEDTTDIFTHAYNAMDNVGVQTQMYLKGSSSVVLSGSQVWEITTKPDGSAAVFGAKQALDSTSEAIVFTPDKVGQYVITFTSNAVSATININAGLYEGIVDGGCGTCHSGKKTEWEGTGHSMHLTRGLNGTLSDHYSAACISCHTVGFDENADNNGFDDRTFNFPDSLFVGQYDSMVVKYPDAMKLANIQCESCHGPASEHHGNPTENRISFSNDVKVCAICHDEGSHHYFPSQWKLSLHSHPTTHPTGPGEASCAQCHTPGGFVQAAEGATVTENPAEPFGCTMCHDPHSNFGDNPVGGKRHQLRVVSDVTLGNGVVVKAGGNGKLCMQCHISRRDAELYTGVDFKYSSHFGPHHGPQTDMLAATNVITFGQKLPSSPHLYATEDACATCHMNSAADIDGSGFPTAGGHTFSMAYPDGTDNVAVCQTCHGDFGPEFSSKKVYINGTADLDGDGVENGLQVEVEGLMTQLAMMLPPIDTNSVDMSGKIYNDLTPTQIKAAYNYMFVNEDKSKGIHNPQFTVALLKVSMEALKYGTITSGEMQSVTDIPMDQGYQVRLVWTAFGADDGVAKDQVKSYTLLRQEMAPSQTAKVAVYESINEIPSSIEPGVMFKLNGDLWDVVAEVPAIQYMEYSAVVPTLHNTVGTDTAWTSFKVLGKTESGIVAETEPMKGFSTDDLAPKPPTNLVGDVSEDGTATDLHWEPVIVSDFNHYNVYRNGEEIGTVVENTFTDANIVMGESYKYKVTAIDHSKNESDASNEVQLTITDIAVENGIPTEFSLFNNYPNPFNPTTNIKFAIPQNSQVKLTIYDSMGKEVNTLVNKRMSPGIYNYTWNATNVATGVYFYRIEAGSFVYTKKMLLIK